jgi:hypothetical protein
MAASGMAAAQDATLDLPLTQVTVFSAEARLVREGLVHTEEGPQRFEVALPAGLVPDSVQAEIDGAELAYIEVREEHNALDADPELGRANEQLEALRNRVALLRGEANILDQEIELLTRLVPTDAEADELGYDGYAGPATPDDHGPDVRELAPTHWIRVARWAQGRLERASARMLEIETQRVDLERSIALRERRFAAQGGHGDLPYRLTLALVAARAGDVSVRLSYRVEGPRWVPIYDVRAEATGDRMQIHLGALVHQGTGQDWEAVRLGVSSADPERSAQSLDLPPWRVAHEPSAVPVPADRIDDLLDGVRTDEADLGWVEEPDEALPFDPYRPSHAEGASGGEGLGDDVGEGFGGDGAAGYDEGTYGGYGEGDYGADEAGYDAGPYDDDEGYLGYGDEPHDAYGYDESGYGDPDPAVVAEDWELLSDPDSARSALLGEYAAPDFRRSAPGPDPDALTGWASHASAADPWWSWSPIANAGGARLQWEALSLHTVLGQEQVTRVPLAVLDLPAQAERLAVPALDPRVFLSAGLTNDRGEPLLGGPVQVFQDGRFIGSTPIPTALPGASLRLPLGTDPQLSLRYEDRVEALRNGQRARRIHRVRIVLSNAGTDAAAVRVLDRIPVTSEARLQIELQRAEPAPESGPDDAGVIRWMVEVPAGGETIIEVDYELSWPRRMRLQGGAP